MSLRRAPALLTVALVTLAVLVAGCTGSSNGSGDTGGANPNADTLLAASSAAMQTVHSLHFTIAVTGSLPSLPVTNADGDLNSAGQAMGTAKLTELGQLVETKFVLINNTFYLLGPTGGWQQVPAELAGSLFDPTAILDPNRGIAQVLTHVNGANTTGKETVDGVSTYKIVGTVSQNVISSLLPGLDADANATVWVATDAKHLPAKADFSLAGATVEITVSHFNESMSVSAPS
jgi:lipoprotein LprG